MNKLLAVFVLFSINACTQNKFSGSPGAGSPSSTADANGQSGGGTPGKEEEPKLPPGSNDGSSNPNGSSGGSTNPDAGNSSTDPNGGGTSNPCVDGDTIKFTFEGPIKACYDAGRVWNFDTSECLQMRQASFACEWQNVIDAMAKIGLSNSSVTAASTNPESKLVGCGESADRNRIVVQWVNIPEGKVVNCKNPELTGTVITGCFTFYPDNNIPPPPANEAERDKQVYACMSQL